MDNHSDKINKEPQKRQRPRFLLWALVISLGLNTFWALSPKDESTQTLATAGGHKFTRAFISKGAQTRLTSLNYASYMVLKNDADTWIENIVLPKEAQELGLTVQALLDQEVFQKSQVSAEEVALRLARSPRADALPYPQAAKEIENELRTGRAQAAKKKFVESLYPKYKAEVTLRPPSDAPISLAPPTSRFPAYEIPANGDPVKGPADAPVTIEIYSDFMCPFSAKFFNTMTDVEKQYPGKIRTVFHQFPLPMHPGAHFMAEASFCAQEQGKFWEFHDRLMTQQKGKKEKEELVRIAQELGLDSSAFQACLESGKNASRVDQNIDMGKAVGVTGTPGYLVNGRTGYGAIPAESMKPLIDWCLKPEGQYPGLKKPEAPKPGAPAPSGKSLDPGKVYPLAPDWLKKSPSVGPENAPVTIVEFLDFHCPFCQRGSATMEKILEKYKGKVRLISKSFPLPMHPNAMKAGIASLCAADQGKFWEYRKELFGGSWGKQTPEDLKAAAKKAGLKENEFNACLDQDKTKVRVDEDMKTASAIGAQGMPTYFINGSPIVGAQPIENFEKVIDAKLAESKK